MAKLDAQIVAGAGELAWTPQLGERQNSNGFAAKIGLQIGLGDVCENLPCIEAFSEQPVGISRESECLENKAHLGHVAYGRQLLSVFGPRIDREVQGLIQGIILRSDSD